jgi:NitT/TauT family transport system substrate-binding protein
MRNGPERADVIDILAKHTSIKDKALYDKIAWSYLDPNGDLSVASLKDQQNWFAARGEVEHKVDLDAVIDMRFHDYAVKTLGRVDTK